MGGTLQNVTQKITDAERDVKKLAKHLMEAKVTQEEAGRETPIFDDPTERGLHNTSWIQDTLATTTLEDDLEGNREDTVRL